MPQEPVTKARLQLLSFLQQTVEQKKIPLDQLSAQTGIAGQALPEILSGNGSPTLDQLLNLCLALGVDISLNVAADETEEDELPDVLLCEEPVQGSDIYLLHTKNPRSLWLCQLVDDEEELDADDTVEFKTFDGYDEQWQISPAAVFEGTSDEELDKAMERCSKYLQAYLSWEDEDLRKSEIDGMN